MVVGESVFELPRSVGADGPLVLDAKRCHDAVVEFQGRRERERESAAPSDVVVALGRDQVGAGRGRLVVAPLDGSLEIGKAVGIVEGGER